MSESSRRPALGRGLSALIPGAAAARPAAPGEPVAPTLPLDRIRAATTQPRTTFQEEKLAELAASITENGILQPIVVRRAGPDDYVIIAGERRFRAAGRAGLREVPVVIREASDAEAFELALVENIQRQDLDPLEEAEAYQHLAETYRMTQEQIARRVGKDRATVANALRLLRAPEALRALLRGREITPGHARAALTLSDSVDQMRIARLAAEHSWSVRQTEREARALRDGPDLETPTSEPPEPNPTPPRQAVERSPQELAVEADLRRVLGAPIRLVNKEGDGRIEIRFHSMEELDRLIDLLGNLEGV